MISVKFRQVILPVTCVIPDSSTTDTALVWIVTPGSVCVEMTFAPNELSQQPCYYCQNVNLIHKHIEPVMLYSALWHFLLICFHSNYYVIPIVNLLKYLSIYISSFVTVVLFPHQLKTMRERPVRRKWSRLETRPACWPACWEAMRRLSVQWPMLHTPSSSKSASPSHKYSTW